MGTLKVHEVKKARRVHETIEDAKADRTPSIQPGDRYYWTKANHWVAVKSKDKSVIEKWIKDYLNSKRGEHSINMEDWNTRLGECEDEDQKQELEQEVEDFLSEKEDRLSNMPDQLQENHILNEQIDELRELLDEIASLEL